ncbi:hypothetical protein HOL34_00750 [bacterium]|jgi:hypothetical protein|nr:hypothetical protein [bacterium]MBT3903229.1 hypothetical protein [bacterium]MBT4578186.1 hypothetical protein [bacterium]MBT5345553.1 hypothetical protein [bacterium]MBT6131088.1 hypothetical protein [bacterium]
MFNKKYITAGVAILTLAFGLFMGGFTFRKAGTTSSGPSRGYFNADSNKGLYGMANFSATPKVNIWVSAPGQTPAKITNKVGPVTAMSGPTIRKAVNSDGDVLRSCLNAGDNKPEVVFTFTDYTAYSTSLQDEIANKKGEIVVKVVNDDIIVSGLPPKGQGIAPYNLNEMLAAINVPGKTISDKKKLPWYLSLQLAPDLSAGPVVTLKNLAIRSDQTMYYLPGTKAAQVPSGTNKPATKKAMKAANKALKGKKVTKVS